MKITYKTRWYEDKWPETTYHRLIVRSVDNCILFIQLPTRVLIFEKWNWIFERFLLLLDILRLHRTFLISYEFLFYYFIVTINLNSLYILCYYIISKKIQFSEKLQHVLNMSYWCVHKMKMYSMQCAHIV